jgi:hypothetical protein
MNCEFGYNCKHYLPTLLKCRNLIDRFRVQKDLVEDKWLALQDTMVYLNLSDDALVEAVASGDMAVKRKKNGKLTFRVSVAGEYDNCYLTTAGICIDFEAHHGPKITCLADLKTLNSEHPNKVPSESEVKAAEAKLAESIPFLGMPKSRTRTLPKRHNSKP